MRSFEKSTLTKEAEQLTLIVSGIFPQYSTKGSKKCNLSLMTTSRKSIVSAFAT